MACESWTIHGRSLVRAAARAGAGAAPRAATRTKSFLPNATHARTAPRRYASDSSAVRKFLVRSNIMEPYRVIASTEQLFKVCTRPADYHITPEERKNDQVQRLEDGEEVGHSAHEGNIWHTQFKLLPTFSTWSHVTMLHLYLVNARIRCFDRDACRNWQQQMIDHFFFECEKKMHVDHGLTSSALRQRYLKDIFVQWRGLILAYDEGLVKGDAVLASAVWRNLFKGAPDVDPRALATIVSWMRSGLAALERAPDVQIEQAAGDILQRPVDLIWKRMVTPVEEAVVDKAAAGSQTQPVKPTTTETGE